MKDSLETETVTVHQKGECFEIIVQHDQSGSAYGMQLTKSAYEQLHQHFVSDGWILVESQLPKRNENVLVKRKKPFHTYFLTGFHRDGVFYSNETAKVLEGVIAWVPLPVCH